MWFIGQRVKIIKGRLHSKKNDKLNYGTIRAFNRGDREIQVKLDKPSPNSAALWFSPDELFPLQFIAALPSPLRLSKPFKLAPTNPSPSNPPSGPLSLGVDATGGNHAAPPSP